MTAARGLFCFHNGDFHSGLCICTREVCVCCIEDGRVTDAPCARLHCFCQLRDERGEFSGHVSKGHPPPIHFSPGETHARTPLTEGEHVPKIY